MAALLDSTPLQAALHREKPLPRSPPRAPVALAGVSARAPGDLRPPRDTYVNPVTLVVIRPRSVPSGQWVIE